MPEKPVERRKIHWLASYPKSGNTWVRCVLSAYIRDGFLDINNIRGTIGDNNRNLYCRVLDRELDNLTRYEQLAARQVVLMHLIDIAFLRDEDVPCILKTHFVNASLHGLPFIPWHISDYSVYLVRDPRDVAISFAKHLGKEMQETVECLSENGMGLGKNGIYYTLSSWSNHVTSWCREDLPVLTVKYEDLLQDPQLWMSKILQQFLGEEPDPVKLAKAIEASSLPNLRRQEEEKGGFIESSDLSIDKFFRVGTAGQWQNILTEKQVKKIEEDHGEMMSLLGYDLAYSERAA